MKTRWLAILPLLALAGCARDDMSDLRQFMQEAGRDSKEQLEPLPAVKTADDFVYDPTNLVDPFRARNLRPEKAGGGGLKPDFNRPKEPLELFPLDGMRMVGTLAQKGQLYALVRTPENTLYRVKKGDRIGQNFGVITSISETGIEIKEIVQDSAGDWSESTASLPVQE